MRVEEAIRMRVVSLPAVTALIGARVWTDKLPEQATYPCARVQFVDDTVPYQLRGPIGTQSARVQVDAFAREVSGIDPYDQALDVLEAIEGDGGGRNATGLAGFIGEIGSPALEILGCFPQSRRRDYDPEELRIVTMSRDFIIWYRT